MVNTILVTGGAGFIGSHFIRYLLRRYRNIAIINLDKLTYSGNLVTIGDISSDTRYRFIKGDIADTKIVRRVFQTYAPNMVVNFAAETHVDRSIHQKSDIFVKTNIEGVHTLLEAAKQSGKIKKFLQVSTDEVYGAMTLSEKKNFSESSLLTPRSPYASTKAAGDLLALSYATSFDIPVVVTRSGNNFGPYQFPEKLIPFFILRMLQENKLPLYGDGKHVRDWVYVMDHCHAIDLCLKKGRKGQIYNIGTGNQKSNFEIAQMILRSFQRDESWIEFVEDRPGHDRRYALNASKIKQELGWSPHYEFQSTLNQTIQWYKNNTQWIYHLQKKVKILNAHIHSRQI